MDELHFSGNCLKGSRPVLSFDATFDDQPYLQVIKEMFIHTFGVPKGSRKSKPFVDHIMAFTVADGKIWIRCYEIGETEAARNPSNETEGDNTTASHSSRGNETKINLVEIGPRFVLTPIVILEGSFGGPVIYENREFVSPNQIRAELRLRRAGRYSRRTDQGVERTIKRGELGLQTHGGRPRPKDDLDDSVLFA